MQAAELALEAVRRRSSPGVLPALGVDVHFHADAPTITGRSVLEAIADDGTWRTQFETGTSNGGLTARPGGDRWRWESRLFDGAYDSARVEERPVYGGLRLVEDPRGSAPRFGSAHLRLRPAVLDRTTCCYPDSAYEPEAVGTVDRAGAVLSALRIRMDDPLDRYVEAHVHGGLGLGDVDAVVLDPSHRGGAVEVAARRLGVDVRWHPGYRLEPDRLAALRGYRGDRAVDAALAVAAGGPLTPALVGAARADGRFDPLVLKRVWHLLAAFGTAGGPLA